MMSENSSVPRHALPITLPTGTSQWVSMYDSLLQPTRYYRCPPLHRSHHAITRCRCDSRQAMETSRRTRGAEPRPSSIPLRSLKIDAIERSRNTYRKVPLPLVYKDVPEVRLPPLSSFSHSSSAPKILSPTCVPKSSSHCLPRPSLQLPFSPQERPRCVAFSRRLAPTDAVLC